MIGPFHLDSYVVGDCRALLAQLPDDSIDCVVTSPPYWGLRDYGLPPVSWGDWQGCLGLEPTHQLYVEHMVQVFREVRRVLKPSGTCWMNLGDSYATDTKWGGSSGKMNGDQGGGARRARKMTTGLKPKDLVGIPWRVAFAMQDDGWYLRSDIIWHKPNPMPESVKDRPTKAHEYVFLLAKSESYHYDLEAIREPDSGKPQGNVDGFKARQGMASFHAKTGGAGSDGWTVGTGRNKRSVWSILTEPTPDAHFATFPRKLVQPCILAGCPAGGVVLDPFGGSGTVGRVAEDTGRHWLLFDMSPEYSEIAKRKTAQVGLFSVIPKPTP